MTYLCIWKGQTMINLLTIDMKNGKCVGKKEKS